MNNITNFGFLSNACKLTLASYHLTSKPSIPSEVISRIAAVMLSPAAALEITYFTCLSLPAIIIGAGKTLYYGKLDFSILWQCVQRVQNAVAPLFLGSLLGIIHPFAGIAVSEPTDKHLVLGILSSNTGEYFPTPCSPIHSLETIEQLAKNNKYIQKDGKNIEIFPSEYVQIVKEAKSYEKSLEILQAQEYIHKISNCTLFLMSEIYEEINQSSLISINKEILTRLSGLLIPVFTCVDIAIALAIQTIFIITGCVRIISGRGPIYTEVTTNPLMHCSFLIQNILKSLGNFIGTLVWFVNPLYGFKVSLLPANAFFKLQLNYLLKQIEKKMLKAKDNTLFALPVVFSEGECSVLSVPTHSMHKTYLIIEKKDALFHLYWINRPETHKRDNLDLEEAVEHIKSFWDTRFPFMDLEKMLKYPIQGSSPELPQPETTRDLAHQGNHTNCVVSNLFGMFEILDKIKGVSPDVTSARYKVVREVLQRNYNFYKNDFYPFSDYSTGYSLKTIWENIKRHPDAGI